MFEKIILVLYNELINLNFGGQAVYRLMVVTNLQSTKDFLQNYSVWTQNGFKFPHFRDSQETLQEGLQKHHIDAIAVRMEDPQKDAEILSFLANSFPLIPIFKAHQEEDKLKISLERLRKALDKINADYTDDDYSYDQKFNIVRNRWFSKYIRGSLTDIAEFEEKNLIYCSNIALAAPCALAELKIPGRADYLLNDWRYGADRLEVALRNFFNPTIFEPVINVAVTETGICRVLFSTRQYLGSVQLQKVEDITAYLEKTVEEIKKYLHLEINLNIIYHFNNHEECFHFLEENATEGV